MADRSERVAADDRRRTAYLFTPPLPSSAIADRYGAIQSVSATRRPPCISQMKPARWAW